MKSEQREQMGYELSALANAALYHLTDAQVDQLKLKVSRAFAAVEDQLAAAQEKIARQEEELRLALAQRQDYRAYWQEARALLEEAEVVMEAEWGRGTSSIDPRDALQKIRAYLATHPQA